jgi:hypothetical protein
LSPSPSSDGSLRRAILAVSVLLLVLSQHGGWLHQLSHQQEKRQAQVAAQHADGEHDRPSGMCELCLAFATFDGGMLAAGLAPSSCVEAATQTALTPVDRPLACTASGYRSRAPPALA